MHMRSARRGGAFVAAGLLLALLPQCSSGIKGPIDGAAAMAHVEHLCNVIGPRPPGSPELQRAGDYILDELKKLGLKPEEQIWTDPVEKIRFRNLFVQIDGTDPVAGPILGIGAHYDTKVTHGHDKADQNFRFVGAIDGAGGPAVLLELARAFKNRKAGPNIWLIWFDGEESLEFDWKDERALFGSWHFVKTMSADKERFPKGLRDRMKTFVLLDLIGDKDIKIDKDVTSNPTLNQIFLDTATAMGEADRMFQDQLSKIFKDDHLPFREFGVTVVDLIDFQWRIPKERGGQEKPGLQAWWHTDKDTPDKMSKAALKFAGDLVYLAVPAIEKEFYSK